MESPASREKWPRLAHCEWRHLRSSYHTHHPRPSQRTRSAQQAAMLSCRRQEAMALAAFEFCRSSRPTRSIQLCASASWPRDHRAASTSSAISISETLNSRMLIKHRLYFEGTRIQDSFTISTRPSAKANERRNKQTQWSLPLFTKYNPRISSPCYFNVAMVCTRSWMIIQLSRKRAPRPSWVGRLDQHTQFNSTHTVVTLAIWSWLRQTP